MQLSKNGFASEKSRPERLKAYYLSEKTTAEHLKEIIGCVFVNVQEGHLPSAKFYWELVQRVEADDYVGPEEYQSLAEVLWKSYREQYGV